MATRFKSVIALLAAVMVVATAACAGDPASERNWANRGNSEMHDKIAADTRARRVEELELAIQDYDMAIQLDPNDAMAYANRGIAYHLLSQDEKSDADKAKACSLDSKYC